MSCFVFLWWCWRQQTCNDWGDSLFPAAATWKNTTCRRKHRWQIERANILQWLFVDHLAGGQMTAVATPKTSPLLTGPYLLLEEWHHWVHCAFGAQRFEKSWKVSNIPWGVINITHGAPYQATSLKSYLSLLFSFQKTLNEYWTLPKFSKIISPY